MKHLLLTALAAFAALAATYAPATAAPITLAADTFITEHPDLGGANRNWGSDPEMYTIAPGGFRSYTLLRFDVEPGTVFAGGATLELFCSRIFGGGVTGVGLHMVTAAWQENTVTWNNLGGAYSGTAFAQNENSIGAGSYARWTIPQSVLQGWSDNPATNYGIALLPTGGRDATYDSRETTTGFAPRISAGAVAVPETSAGMLLVTGATLAGGLVLRRTRRGRAA